MSDLLEKIIYGLKYHEQRALGGEIGGRLADMFKGVIRELNPDVMVPVPLYPAKGRERSFNQSDLIGRTVAGHLQIPYEPRLVKRVRNTKSQTELSIDDRRENMAGAFAVGDLAPHRRFLIVDDVLTSGATLSECAKALRRKGASFVAVLTAGTPPVHFTKNEKAGG